MQDFTKTTLGELLNHPDVIIQRNANSILKQLQKLDRENETEEETETL